MPVLYLLAPDEEAIASKACANKFFYSDLSLYSSRTRRKTIIVFVFVAALRDLEKIVCVSVHLSIYVFDCLCLSLH